VTVAAAGLDVRVDVAADWTALGCAVRLVVRDPDDLANARLILVEELEAIDLACSRFRPDSELSRLCERAGRPAPMSTLLAEAVGAALDAAAATDGDLDPTVGFAMDAIGYDRDFARIEVDGAAIRVVPRPVPGWRQVTLDRRSRTLRVPIGVQLDLGATAKAFVADRAAARIAAAIDGRGVLVALGGDIAVAGEPPADGWSVRVQDITGPLGAAPSGPTQLIALVSGGLATSSTAARRWVRGGRVMHHILDPRTGVPVASPWRTVTVAAPTCLAANVASTTAIIRGVSALDWLARRGLAARFVDLAGAVTTLRGWPDADGRPR
jgi:thiamine biosynthesis lipoprotein ApbE